MGLIQYSASILLICLFSLAVISYAIGFGDDNEAVINIDNDEVVSNVKSSIEGNLTVYHSNVNTSSKIFTESTISAGSETFESGGVWKTMTETLPDSLTNVARLTNQKIFGNDIRFGIVTTAFVTFIASLAILYIWKAWRGDPE
ncbi:MAG: hypothetical protein EHM20_00350 [Alphaproteobacteria bacterium]|nr:MAG: hypothetical protein EHM20_00350 [Alphaproteobacteria bacterium]